MMERTPDYVRNRLPEYADMIKNILTAATLSVALGAGVIACSDSNPAGPDDASLPLPSGMVVSNAVGAAAYVSAAPGTFQNVVQAAVRNETRAGPPRVLRMIEGGFDPLGVNAQAGDELSVTFSVAGVGVRPTIVTRVPDRRAPAVVRTHPAKAGVDVGLNVEVLVVFSEPVDRSSVTSSSVALLQSADAVNGTVQISADGLSAGFTPDTPLQLQTTYSVAVSQGIRDGDGDALDKASTIAFTTTPRIPARELVFSQLSDRQIYRISADGTGLIQLTGTGQNGNPAWSPDGRRIAFARNVPGSINNGQGTTDIYLMDADGSNTVQRTFGSQFWSAAWSPDGHTLALSDEGIYYAAIYVLSAENDDMPPRVLATDARSPAWSPDGKQIAYVRTSGDAGYDEVYVMYADGTGARPLTANGGGIYGLAWSPNGKRIAYSKCLLGSCDLYVMDADGGGTRQVTSVGNVQEAAWSPDGTWIALTLSNYSGSDWQPSIAYVRAEGGIPRVVVAGGFNPSWRP